MANVSLTFTMRLVNGGLTDQYSTPSTLGLTQNSAFLVRNVQTISNAAHSALDLGSVVTPGWAAFINLDTTNFVEVGIDVGGTFYPFLKLKPGQASPALPGEQFPCRLGTAAPYAKANTAPVKLFYIIYND